MRASGLLAAAPAVAAGETAPAFQAAFAPRLLEAANTLVEHHVLEIALLGLSVVAVALALERFYALVLCRESILPAALLNLIGRMSRQQSLDEAQREELLRACRSDPSVVSGVVEGCLRHAGQPLAALTAVGNEALKVEYEKACGVTRHLSLIGRIGPYVGLLGTVLGMIVAFHQTGSAEAGRQGLLARGLSTSMGATAAGILVALLASGAAHFARQRLGSLFAQMQASVLQLLPLLSGPQQPDRRANHV